MSQKFFRVWMAVAALCASSFAGAQVRISEFHYDNTGADTGEQVEVSAPAGTDLTGWRVVLYNGSGGASYATLNLTGVVPATCDTRGVVVLPAVGLQNGPPDGLALVDAGGVLIEFLSYEGVFAATTGAANGILSVDVGVIEVGTEPIGQSLARDAAGVWSGPAASTFGACNDNGSTPPAAEVASITVAPASATLNVGATLSLAASAFDAASAPIPGTAFTWTTSDAAVATVSPAGLVTGVAAGDAVISATAANGVAGSAAVHVNDAPPPTSSDFHINEIHYDNVGTDTGEAIEIEGPAGADLLGFSIVLYNGNGGVTYNTQALSGVLPTSCGTRGVTVVTYPTDGIQNGPDAIALVSSSGQVLEYLSYEGTFPTTNGPAAGLVPTDIVVSQSNAGLGQSLQRGSTGTWASGVSSFGACNPDVPTPGGNSLSFSGRLSSDPALPVGFEDQLFATLRGPGNVTIPTTITWTSETPATASIDANGVLRSLAEGTATVRATATDGTTATYSLPTRIGLASATAQYANNAEFGEPVDEDPSDDYILRHPQFTSSYNANRGSPNWVAYEFDATHFGDEDRCDCFTMDPALPASFPRLTTADYTGAGAFHGFGIDRGHLARSFDRTAGSLDNAFTFLFSNIIPQAAEQNQGPWAQLENHLGDFARFSNREVYVVTGVAGNAGTIKNEGRIVIPTHTWKVALILPRDQGLADIRDYRDVEYIAVLMPNVTGIRDVPWQTYLTTVDAIEAASGYDLLALLPDAVESAVESGTQPPIAAISGPAGTIVEGDSVSLGAAGSIDPNGSIVSYAWDFGDGTTDTGVSVTHTFAQDGAYAVSLTVIDNDGFSAVTMFTVNVSNAAPTVGAVPDGAVNVGATYAVSGTFSDPGADAWSATVDWGDGSEPDMVVLSDRSFSLSHVYTAAGSFVVSIGISDDDALTSSLHTVAVAQPAPGLEAALPLIDGLVANRKITRAVGTVLKAGVVSAQRLVERGNTPAAIIVLKAVVVEIDLLVRFRAVSAADMAPLRGLLVGVINAL